MIKKNILTVTMLFAALLLIIVSSCDSTSKYEKREKEEIQDYITRNTQVHFILKPSGLYYFEVEPGSGVSPVSGDTVSVKYTGLFLDGVVFDSNEGKIGTYDYIVGWNNNVEGFNEGISYMKTGGKSIVLIPSSLGWGAIGSFPYIDGYTPVLFQLELVRIKQGPVK